MRTLELYNLLINRELIQDNQLYLYWGLVILFKLSRHTSDGVTGDVKTTKIANIKWPCRLGSILGWVILV